MFITFILKCLFLFFKETLFAARFTCSSRSVVDKISLGGSAPAVVVPGKVIDVLVTAQCACRHELTRATPRLKLPLGTKLGDLKFVQSSGEDSSDNSYFERLSKRVYKETGAPNLAKEIHKVSLSDG